MGGKKTLDSLAWPHSPPFPFFSHSSLFLFPCLFILSLSCPPPSSLPRHLLSLSLSRSDVSRPSLVLFFLPVCAHTLLPFVLSFSTSAGPWRLSPVTSLTFYLRLTSTFKDCLCTLSFFVVTFVSWTSFQDAKSSVSSYLLPART